MDDQSILHSIKALMDREHALRAAREDGVVDAGEEVEELARLEVDLDQCWDLLRQRRAKRDFGRDADEAEARPASMVERYWQ